MRVEYIFLAVLVFLLYSITLLHKSQEGFENGSSVTIEDFYDDVYASVYDLLWNPKDLLEYERVSIQDIALAERPVSAVRILDMACGTGRHACWFKNLGVDYVGVDTSESMLKKARDDCPSAQFQKGDITQVHLFPQKSMSHCLLLGFSVYEFQNPKILSDNAYQWLQPDGFFVVHLVDPDNYDPLLDLASPFAAFSLQKYSLDRKTDSVVYFDQFKYTGKLIKKTGEDNAEFNEVFTYYDESSNEGVKYREQKHHWMMPSKERMIDIFKSSGFRHIESVNLTQCGKEYQYLVYMQK